MDSLKLLGLDEYASLDDIRKAYKEKAKLYHPDVNKSPNATALLQQVNIARDWLLKNHSPKRRPVPPKPVDPNTIKLYRISDSTNPSVVIPKSYKGKNIIIYLIIREQEFRLHVPSTVKDDYLEAKIQLNGFEVKVKLRFREDPPVKVKTS